MSELLPCPFCGSNQIGNSNEEPACWFVKCQNCGARGPWHDSDCEHFASRDWNVRRLEKFEGKVIDYGMRCSPGIRVVYQAHPESLRPKGEELLVLDPTKQYRLIVIEEQG